MKEGEMFSIRVPASTANLGPGFDSLGLALGLYLEIQGCLSDKWKVVPLTEEMERFPDGETNFIVTAAKKTAAVYQKVLPPCRFTVASEIPLARGLGSSAAAIAAGIELADVAAELGLSRKEKIQLASRMEGHPDNAGAAVAGGLAAGWQSAEEIELLNFPLEGVKVLAVIPDFELKTENSRQVLPEKLKFKEAVSASAAANVLLAALLSQNWKLAGKMMNNDLLHQPYRSKIVPHLAEIAEAAKMAGAAGTALSGAGPSVLCLAENDDAAEVEMVLKERFPSFSVRVLEIDNEGVRTRIFKENALLYKKAGL